MLRFEIAEAGQAALPAIDVADPVIAIGSGAAARIRLPAGAAKPEQLRIEAGKWRGEAIVDGVARTSGEIGDGVTFELGTYRVRVAPAPPGAVAAPPQRTESLARELVRNLLGAGAAPTLEIERGPVAGGKRVLAPPDSVLVIGRGDEAGWVILDGDLSKTHAEIRRGWDGVRVIDLEAKNGTRLDGALVGDAELHDGALLELGNVQLRFRDPAERHLRGEAAPVPAKPVVPAPRPAPSPVIFYAAITIMLLAIAGFIWVLTA